jgi:hypothetical protein
MLGLNDVSVSTQALPKRIVRVLCQIVKRMKEDLERIVLEKFLSNVLVEPNGNVRLEDYTFD